MYPAYILSVTKREKGVMMWPTKAKARGGHETGETTPQKPTPRATRRRRREHHGFLQEPDHRHAGHDHGCEDDANAVRDRESVHDAQMKEQRTMSRYERAERAAYIRFMVRLMKNMSTTKLKEVLEAVLKIYN